MVLCLYINKTETETGKYKKDKDRNIKVNVHLTAFGFEVESSISGIDSFQSGPIPPPPFLFPIFHSIYKHLYSYSNSLFKGKNCRI